MKMKKPNAMDIVIIAAVIAIAVAAVAVKCFKKSNIISPAQKTLIQFDILATDLNEAEAQSIKANEGTSIIFGKTNTDSGIIKSVRIEPYESITRNVQDGQFVLVKHPTSVQAVITVEAEVTQTADSFVGSKEEIRIGEQMPFLGKGFGVSNAYVIDMREVSK